VVSAGEKKPSRTRYLKGVNSDISEGGGVHGRPTRARGDRYGWRYESVSAPSHSRHDVLDIPVVLPLLELLGCEYRCHGGE
jgi:hypothetical protein